MKELVSIIIPVYNVENYLEKCIFSIINQDYKYIEILLIDDGSTDNSLDICKKYEKIDKRIKVFHKENGGLSDARNFGIKYARGTYICFVDSDDYIDEKYISILLSSLIESNSDISICNRYHFFDDNVKKIKFKSNYEPFVMNSEEAIFNMNNFEYFDMSATCKLFNKKLFKNIDFPKGKKCEDFYIMYKIFDSASLIVSNPKPLYYYYQRLGSISKTNKLLWDFVYAAMEQKNFVESKYPNLKDSVYSAFASANMTIYNNLLKYGGKCSKSDLKILKKNVKESRKYVYLNKKLSLIKKIQTYLFIHSLFFYKILFKFYKIIDR